MCLARPPYCIAPFPHLLQVYCAAPAIAPLPQHGPTRDSKALQVQPLQHKGWTTVPSHHPPPPKGKMPGQAVPH